MASSLKLEKIHDVFLSFRGAEIRHNFVGHLYQALNQNGIRTFRDSEELKKGDQISPMLMEAIEESYIAVIVFSQDYASSEWCLEEVAKIMECKEQRNLTVLPVFYKVEPREVRKGRMSYQRALDKHKSKFGEDSEKVKRWEKALFNAGSLSGWPLNDGDESKLIQEIVKRISRHLDRMPLHVAKHPVGIESQVVMLKSMLNLESNDIVVMVGLWGQGGIGKTTLAKALYNSTFRQFEGSCFLANVRDTSKGCKDLVTLQEILLKDTLLLQQRLEVSNVDQGINIIQHRLGRKKVLLILDDVDDLRQLNALAGEGKWFGNGSRIIITTRDKHVLTRQGIYRDHVYEVEALDDSQACELLSKHASQTHQIRKDLVNGALNYANGLPLALEVLGSLVCGETDDVWESTLMKLSRSPNKNINNVLKISYEGLDENEKEIFLHIACFFRGCTREYIKKVLESCDLETTVGFQILVKRSLIRVESDILEMHDLIQLMGEDIVNQECRDDPGRRSRLWLYDDVEEVLSNDKEDCAVKAIVLRLPKWKKMRIHRDAFTKMRRLRLLILRNLQDSFQGPLCLPKELRWFEWPGCAHQIIEFSPGSKKLVGIDMSNSSFGVVLEQFKDFRQLKYINFSYCESLIRIPDLSCTPHLEELVLSSCKNMVEAHESIGYLEKLWKLRLDGCSQLGVFPHVLKTKRIQRLNLTDCKNLERFPHIPHKLESLTLLSLRGTAIKELPSSIENLVSLKILILSDCKDLISLPSSIYKLHNIEELELSDCTSFIRFPKYDDSADPSMKVVLPSLKFLDLAGSGLTELEFLENHSCCPKLSNLSLTKTKITSVPTSIFEHKHFEVLYLPSHISRPDRYKIPNSYSFLSDGISFVEMIFKYPYRAVYDVSFPEAKFPEWVLPIENGFVSFRASRDLCNKFLGFVICAVHSTDEQDHGSQSYHIESKVNGQMLWKHEWTPVKNHTSFLLFIRRRWNTVNFGQIYGSHEQFSFKVSGGVPKKCGFRIMCEPLEEDLKVKLEDLMDPALLFEYGHESTYSKAMGPLMHGTIKADIQNDLQDCPATLLSASRQLVSI
ncbi:disease resistance protein RUN1 [Eucalyptus grandis]|uniref:disease resistance protein RUN1 n=1 Tax=Eucalyptus grandis TaxID=71139 RepID=UPI00192EEB2F|nr:disease resistance protein RUN1 [Eucalyptus grandis]